MKRLTKDNISNFLEYYHTFHDSYITNMNYDISTAQIELWIEVYWSGEPSRKEDGTYETNKTRMRMLLNGVEKCHNKEIASWDYIDSAFIKYVKLNHKEFICFADDEEDPSIYVVCDHIEYEEIIKT